MKRDEKIFFVLCFTLSQLKICPRDVVNMLNETIPHKRCWYYLFKWSEKGFYTYGTTLDLGWFYNDKLPDRYKELLSNEK